MEAYMAEPMKIELKSIAPPPGLEGLGRNHVSKVMELPQTTPLLWRNAHLKRENARLAEERASLQLAQSSAGLLPIGFAACGSPDQNWAPMCAGFMAASKASTSSRGTRRTGLPGSGARTERPAEISGKEQDAGVNQYGSGEIDYAAAKSRTRQMRILKNGDQGMQIEWPIDAKKLRSSDTLIVSPPFEVAPGMTCKLMIKPTTRGDRKGQGCFRKAKGRGCVQLKCFADTSCPDTAAAPVPSVSCHLSIGSGGLCKAVRDPVTHNFADATVCSLHSEMEELDFNSVVDSDSMTCIIRLGVRKACSSEMDR
jgi:hypothetical protein